jgi:hypothetical protein
MRLWSIHPRYVDRQGLVAAWREALLAKAVLGGRTKGYRHHPQLERFKEAKTPLNAINAYLFAVWEEAVRRGYAFDRSKIEFSVHERIPVTTGQLQYEMNHLKRKLEKRSPRKARELDDISEPEPHPLFFVVEGEIAPWEKC